jgi:hypothetical protein
MHVGKKKKNRERGKEKKKINIKPKKVPNKFTELSKRIHPLSRRVV